MRNYPYRTNWICLGLLILMFVKAGVMPVIWLDYELRKEYIVKNLCVNRKTPQLHCDGKCYLAKKLAENQKQEEKTAENSFFASLIYQVMNPMSDPVKFERAHYDLPVSQSFVYTSSFLGTETISDIFRPPLFFS